MFIQMRNGRTYMMQVVYNCSEKKKNKTKPSVVYLRSIFQPHNFTKGHMRDEMSERIIYA